MSTANQSTGEKRDPTVLILGGGINGCALVRELTLNGVGVWLVDVADVASGATAGSSRLIHGGLRYLEYGELDLVKESLAERTRLLRLAPQFVHPLKLWIPSANRLGGATIAIGRFFGWNWWPARPPTEGRGAWLVRAGLTMYDAYARDPHLPQHAASRLGDPDAPRVNSQKYHWLSSYYDAQVTYPERLLIALLDDARALAQANGVDFRVFTYHQAKLAGTEAVIEPVEPCGDVCQPKTLTPAAIVNATGAWVDETLERLQIPAKRLMGGTKGSHLFTFSTRLRDLLRHDGIYAEAPDGRPIFITPLAETVLIGTTDERYEGPPENARATDSEIHYLLGAVNTIFPDARLELGDVDFHYSAVRPLPYVDAKTPAAITRRHAIVKESAHGVPLLSLVGGKLTTMRSLAESAAAEVLAAIDRKATQNSRERPIPGGGYDHADRAAVAAKCQEIAARSDLPVACVAAVWQLCGSQADEVLSNSAIARFVQRPLVADTVLPTAMAAWSIEREHARCLADLVERRLMLLYHQRLTRACLGHLAEMLIEAGQLPPSGAAAAVDREVERLQTRYAKHVE